MQGAPAAGGSWRCHICKHGNGMAQRHRRNGIGATATAQYPTHNARMGAPSCPCIQSFIHPFVRPQRYTRSAEMVRGGMPSHLRSCIHAFSHSSTPSFGRRLRAVDGAGGHEEAQADMPDAGADREEQLRGARAGKADEEESGLLYSLQYSLQSTRRATGREGPNERGADGTGMFTGTHGRVPESAARRSAE